MKEEQITNLVQKARNKDNDAIGELYELIYPQVYFTAYKVLKNKESAEDIAQDSFITCITKLDSLKDDSAFFTFINRTAMNKSLNYLRDSKFELSDVTVNDDGEEVVMDIEDTSKSANVEKVINDEETQRMVMEIIDRLPELQRMTIMLFYYEDFNITDIAKIMECSENTVKSRLNYARKAIKAEVEKLRKKYGDDILVVVPFLGSIIKNVASKEISVDMSIAKAKILEDCAAKHAVAKEGKIMSMKSKIITSFVKSTTKSLVIKGLGIVAGISVITGAAIAVAANNNNISADTKVNELETKPAEVPSVVVETTTEEVKAEEPVTEVEEVEVVEAVVEKEEETTPVVEDVKADEPAPAPVEEVVDEPEPVVEEEPAPEPVVEYTDEVGPPTDYPDRLTEEEYEALPQAVKDKNYYSHSVSKINVETGELIGVDISPREYQNRVIAEHPKDYTEYVNAHEITWVGYVRRDARI